MKNVLRCKSVRLRVPMFLICLALVGTTVVIGQPANAEDFPMPGTKMTDQQVAAFAKLALDGIDREFPNKPSNVLVDAGSAKTPSQMHPAFYGSFDWHSSIHGHWMLARLVRQYPDCTSRDKIIAALDEHLTAENLAAEAEYFRLPHNRSFERMYGWAWALRLVAELHTWDHAAGKRWRENLRPLEQIIVQRTKDYLPKLSYPIRTGVHPDSGFALGQVLDYARIVGDAGLAQLIETRARHYYLKDVAYPATFEPSGEDFFSTGLNEIDLMRRVLSQAEFSDWLTRFLPDLATGKAGNLLTPVEVSDVTDGKIVHLAGLDLSRAWTLRGIASALPNSDARREILETAATQHTKFGLKYVFSGHYEGEHWLATFAVYLLTDVGIMQ